MHQPIVKQDIAKAGYFKSIYVEYKVYFPLFSPIDNTVVCPKDTKANLD